MGGNLFIVLGSGLSQKRVFFFIQGRGHHYWGLRERKGAQRLGDFLFGIGISVFDVGGLGAVRSSGSIWESRHQSLLVSFGTGSFKNSSTKLKRLLRVFICGSGSFWETVYPNQLFSLIVSHQPIFLLPTANTDDFIFLRCCCLRFHWGCISVFYCSDVKELTVVFRDSWLILQMWNEMCLHAEHYCYRYYCEDKYRNEKILNSTGSWFWVSSSSHEVVKQKLLLHIDLR